MNIYQLKEKFPSLQVSKKPIPTDETVLSFFEAPYYFTIAKNEVAENDAAFLNLLFKAPEPTFMSAESKAWYDLLFTQNAVSLKESFSRYRFVQFHIRKENYTKKEFSEWKKALLSFFNQKAEMIVLGTYGVIAEEIEGSVLGEGELAAVATTLEADFYFPVHFFVGLFHKKHLSIRDAFLEERRLFDLQDKALVQTVESASLKHFAHALEDSTLSAELSAIFQKDDTLPSLIATLFENQGNISMTAKALFMHRNTIQYRIDKFHEQTNLSLRKSDGLLYAYLSSLTIQKSANK